MAVQVSLMLCAVPCKLLHSLSVLHPAHLLMPTLLKLMLELELIAGWLQVGLMACVVTMQLITISWHLTQKLHRQ